MTSLLFGIALFFLHALVLKLAVGVMGAPREKNSYSKALTIAFALSVVGFLLGFVPLVSWLLYGVVWLGVIMSAYDLGFMRSIGVAFTQVGLKIVLWFLLKLFGVSVALSQLLTSGL